MKLKSNSKIFTKKIQQEEVSLYLSTDVFFIVEQRYRNRILSTYNLYIFQNSLGASNMIYVQLY